MPPDYTDLASDDEIEEMVCSECGETIRECVCGEEEWVIVGEYDECRCWRCKGRGWVDVGPDDYRDGNVTCPECEGEEGRP